MGSREKEARRANSSGLTFNVFTRKPAVGASRRQSRKRGYSWPRKPCMRRRKTGGSSGILRRGVGDLQGFIQHNKAFPELLFGDDERRQEEKRVPVGVEIDPMFENKLAQGCHLGAGAESQNQGTIGPL